ncbi:MAG: IS30 family transposase [Gemmataceae bacterium]|nr:IS30 family transposase [Gemmataceae bacterium]
MRHGGRKRAEPEKRWKIVDPVAIGDRPAAANQRLRFGDWEGDTVVSRGRKGGVLTLVDRRSRYTLVEKVRDLKADTINAAMRVSLADLPEKLRRTMTLDNDKEFAGHEELAECLNLDNYFAEPYAAWQRGTVENNQRPTASVFPQGDRLQNGASVRTTPNPGSPEQPSAQVSRLPNSRRGSRTTASSPLKNAS